MHPLQCHGPSRPVSMFADPSDIAAAAYTSPSTSSPASSVGLPSDVRLETACSPVTTSSYSPSSSAEQSPSLAFQKLHQHQSSPESRKFLKRRASQGSFPANKPSSVSRFLSRNPAATNSATSTIGGGTSGTRDRDPSDIRAQSFDSSLRLTTASDPSRSEPASWQSDYPAALPPTPPEDNDDTVPVAWNPSGMLLVEPQLNPGHPGQDPGPGSGPLVGHHHHHHDHHPSKLGGAAAGGHAKVTPTVDGISSPSDQLSSAAASPGSNDTMDCGDDNSWLENGIDAASMLLLSNLLFFFSPHMILTKKKISCVAAIDKRWWRNRQAGFSDFTIPPCSRQIGCTSDARQCVLCHGASGPESPTTREITLYKHHPRCPRTVQSL